MINTDQLALTITDGTGTFHFAGHPIRFVMKDGEPWFVAIDCGKALGIVKARKAVEMFPEDEKDAAPIRGSDNRPRETIVLSLPGLLRMIFQSRKAEAEAFKRYVYHEVIPAIQKTGRYEVAPVLAMPPAPVPPTLAELIDERRRKYEQLRRESAMVNAELSQAEGELASLAEKRDGLKDRLAEVGQKLREEYDGLRGVLEPLRELARHHAWPRVLTEEAVSTEALRLAGTLKMPAAAALVG